jgi:hypothetical protein
MPADKISYSSILIEFIKPLLKGNEDDNEFLAKAKAGMIAWNLCVFDSTNLPMDGLTKKILWNVKTRNPFGADLFDKLAERKALLFPDHNQFIFKVELREKPDGSKTLYVEWGSGGKIGSVKF